MKRSFTLTIYCKNEFKNTPLALECKEAILREMPFLAAVNIKEWDKKPHGGMGRNDK